MESELSLKGRSDFLLSIRESTQDSINQAGQQITQKNLNIQPTIKVRPGYPLSLCAICPKHEFRKTSHHHAAGERASPIRVSAIPTKRHDAGAEEKCDGGRDDEERPDEIAVSATTAERISETGNTND